MYFWRKMSEKQRAEALEYRRIQRWPKHSPPHFAFAGSGRYLITASCYEHAHVIGASHQRLTELEIKVLEACEKFCSDIYAWCILPNHYHLLVRTEILTALRQELGRVHGRTAFLWNGEDSTRGRQVWHNCFERKITSEGHYYASLNFVLNNAVHHGYAEKWQDWEWSNANQYLEDVGAAEAERVWREYPLNDYGKKWDIY
jgi:putative transposase